ncbi:MAG TPA: helix-hairpin-helix domain-containing protein, partial [Hanamia sp.]|nr:helix-hairpin-helix domain-containing protein [Hanamia sp.]
MKTRKAIKNVISYSLFVLLTGLSADIKAQITDDEPAEMMEQQLEDISSANEETETEDDAYLQQMHHFLKEPLNLNYADAGLLEQLNLLSPIQIANLLSYRKLFGNFLSIYELQAIPGWDLPLIKKIAPYISIDEKTAVFQSLRKRLKNGSHTILLRSAQ